MPKKISDTNLPVYLFVIVSLAIVLAYFLLTAAFSVSSNMLAQKEINSGSGSDSQYYFRDYQAPDDPFITKNPGLEDVLAGPIIDAIDPGMGPLDAGINIVVFSDFICQPCRAQEEIIKQVIADYAEDARLIWKDYPESDPLSLSFLAAKAARCADRQGKFWEYHDRLFGEDELTSDKFGTIAAELGLDQDVFDECFSGDTISELIYDNMEEANALDINGVPFIFINDREILGETAYDDLKMIIEAELAG